jgi:hypothetical protein
MYAVEAEKHADASYHCHSCDQWYRRKDVPINDSYFNEKDRLVFRGYCTCGAEVFDEHELNGITPYDEKRLEELHLKKYRLKKELRELEEEIRNIE